VLFKLTSATKFPCSIDTFCWRKRILTVLNKTQTDIYSLNLAQSAYKNVTSFYFGLWCNYILEKGLLPSSWWREWDSGPWGSWHCWNSSFRLYWEMESWGQSYGPSVRL